MTIGAIETSYNGYMFRSRLEARWAVFFDALGLKYRYEPDGFEKKEFSDHGEELAVRYLPDFHLTGSNTWVEVKGSDDALKKESDFLERFLDRGSPLPGFDNSWEPLAAYIKVRGLLILGDIPNPTNWGFKFHRIVQHHKGLLFGWAYFSPSGPATIDHYGSLMEFFEPDGGWSDWTTACAEIPTSRWYPAVRDAYAAARSARFEHGQTPKP